MTNKLSPPQDDYLDVFKSCISNLSHPAKQKFIDNESYFLNEGKEFDKKIAAKKLYTTQKITAVKNISKKEMTYLYTGKLSKLGQPARDFYDRWRSIAPYGTCPLCGVRTVSTLDHYLPKQEFPVFSIYPLNLIPACKDCNIDKRSEVATSHEKETIHPYFDTLEDDCFLHSQIIQTRPASFIFEINPPASWPNDIQTRLKNHFIIFNLNQLYVTLAAQELSNIRLRLEKLNKISTEQVKAYLKDELETRIAAKKNSWQTAIYSAMHSSDWFHSNGFLF